MEHNLTFTLMLKSTQINQTNLAAIKIAYRNGFEQ
jgi:hypothetical protein